MNAVRVQRPELRQVQVLALIIATLVQVIFVDRAEFAVALALRNLRNVRHL